MTDSPIPSTRVAAFIRQYTHDVRNTINCMDLEMELMQDVVNGAEAVTSMNRIREQLKSMEVQMRSLSSAFHDPRPSPDPISARVLLQIWREKQAEMSDTLEIEWVDKLEGSDVDVEVDVEMIASVFNELLTNAATHAQGKAITVSVSSKDGQVLFELREPKSEKLDASSWAQPFSAAARGRYGLGLWAAKRKLEANKAAFRQYYDDKEACLVTEVGLPVHEDPSKSGR